MCKKSKIHRKGQRTCPSDLLVSRHRLIYLVSLCLVLGLAGSSKAAVIGFQAESGTLGAHFDPPIIDPNALGGRYITIESDGAGGTPGHENRIATYTVTFPEAGTYDLYARLYIDTAIEGAADCDSMFYGNGFGTKTANDVDDWTFCNGLDANPSDEWFWINLSEDTGQWGEAGVSFTVPAGELTQTLQVGAREDYLRMDAFVFATATGTFYDRELDAAVPQETKAFGADPADGSLYSGTSVNLSWLPGAYAADVDGHKIYFDPSEAEVQARSGCDVNGVSRTEPNYPVSGLVPGTWYYWAVDEVNGLDIWPGDVWSFEVQSLTAYNPYPYDGEISIDTDVVLAWSPGISAVSHNVYLDKIKTNVDARSGCLVDGVSTTEPNYYPGPLDLDTTYYWAIDEVGGPPDNTIYTGNVLSFTTMPDIQISDPNLIGWWTLDEGAGRTALDWSGHGNHGAIQGDPVWVSGYSDYGSALDFDGLGDYVNCGNAEIFNITRQITVAAWIRVDLFEQTDQGIVSKGENAWRLVRNEMTDQLRFDCGAVGQATGSTNVNDDEWHHALGLYDGTGIYLYVDGSVDGSQSASGLIDTDDITVFIADTNRPGTGPQAWNGLIDDVRIYNKALTRQEILLIMRIDRLLAWNPKPAMGRVMDLIDAETELLPLSWSPGDEALHHDVYFGTDYAAVDAADASDTTGIYRGQQDANNYTPPESVERGQTYYWRIDEINTDATISEGRIWNFTIADYLIVDNFEDYNNFSPDKVYQTWIDGLGYTKPPPGVPGNGTGSTVGHDIISLDSPYYQGNIIETSIVHVPGQSMPMDYNNVNDPFISEAIRTWDTPQDWTAEGVAALTIWFRGYRQSVGGISYNAATQTYTMTGAGADIYELSDEFHYAYKQLSGEGSITAKVESLTEINAWSKAGVMIRETLDADSAQVLVSVTPQNGVEFMYRLAGDTTTAWAEAGLNAPHWVRIRRVQNDFFAEHSTDNVTWVDVQGDNPSSANIPMSVNTYIGLHLCSHEEFQTAEAVFSNVRIIGDVTPTGPFTQSQDIGILSNDADRFYVILEDDDDNSHLVEYPEPNATQIYEWQDFNIDMREFTNAGVNTAAITKMTLGVGNKAAPASAGTGSMYFDDIRLHWPRCVPSQLQPVGDLNDDCVVNYSDIDEMAGEWLSIPAPGAELIADLDGDGDVDFSDYAELASAWLEERIWPVL